MFYIIDPWEDLRMQKRKLSAKLISLLLTLSILVSTFSIFAFADETNADEALDTLNVVYNRTFEEGWDYNNGISSSFAQGNKVGVTYEYTGSSYNHYLRLDKLNTKVGYVHIDTEGRLPTEGKSFIQLDVLTPDTSSFGQAVRVSVQGNLKTLVEFKADGMYVLGKNVGRPAYPMQWQSLAFAFDFDYGTDAYKVTAYHFGELVTEVEWARPAGGFGISQVRFSFGNVLEESVGSWYGIDNLRVYSGSDEFSVIGEGVYGSAVDSDAKKDYVLVTAVTDPDGYVRGEGKLDRVEVTDSLVNHYNRHFGEGWTVNQASAINPLQLLNKDNEIDIKGERGADGNANYYLRYRALNSENGFMVIPVRDAVGNTAYIEFDLKAGVNADLGGIMQLRGAEGSKYPIEIIDGQLVVGDTPVGYIGTDWVHIAIALDASADTCTVYFGKAGVVTFDFVVGKLTDIRIGSQGGSAFDSLGDWFGIDNLQIYTGTSGFVTLPEDDYGTSVDIEAPADLLLEDVVVPDASVVPDGGLPEDGGNSGELNAPVVNYDKEEMLSGSPDLTRVETDENTIVRYNRHYGEGWDFEVGGGKVNTSIMKLENEQTIDLSYNYYQYYEASGSGNSYWTLSPGSTFPKTGKVFMEFDFRAVEGCNLGGFIQMRQAGGAPNPYIIGCNDGYLWVLNSNNKIGKINDTDWVHLAFEFDYDYYKDDEANANYYMITVHFGQNRCIQIKQQRGGSVFGISGFRIGFETQPVAAKGQYWHMDNLQLYAGTETFADIPADNHGSAITGNEPKDFPIQTGGTSLETMIKESLFMKLGSDYTYVNATRQPALVDEETGDVYGAPVEIDDVVWVPLDTILNFLSYPIYVHEDGQSFDISTGATITYITLGRNTAIVAGEKIDLNAPPAIISGEHDYLAVSIEDLDVLFPEFYVRLDNMNMITFTKYEDMVGEISENIKINQIMKNFLFDYISAGDIYERARDNTNNFDHPYLYANQEKWDEIRAVWLAGRLAEDSDPTNDVPFDPTLYAYINRIVNSTISGDYAKYSATKMTNVWNGERFEGAEYEGLHAQSLIFDNETNGIGLTHSYLDSNGYDPIGGRLYPPYGGLSNLGIAYQITRDERFALLAYDWAEQLADWNHWGPGHFLNCADTAGPMGLIYDWCYDAWVSLGLDTDKIADGIYYHGVLQGYLVAVGKPDPHGRRGGNGSTYTTMVNNWNAVCTSGIARAAFAVMDYDGFDEECTLKAPTAVGRVDEYGGANMLSTISHVIAANFKSLVKVGIDIYAPDGSYEESVSYWAYGAGNLFAYSATLKSALGDDLGIMDTWGVDRTCYSILHMVSSDWVVFAYNDGSVGGGMTSTYFAYVADAVGDPGINAVRQMHIKSGKVAAGLWDVLYYTDPETIKDIELELQYHHIGIHGYTVRSSWEKGAIYAGLLGGDNDDGHGHIDAGQWIYYNKGIRFIEDIGPDGYNTYNYFNNNHMYKTTTEGHNVICVVSDQAALPAGQERHSVSPVTKVYDNEYGAYAITDCTPAFGKTLTYARRGMMITNDRNTVIIQDEISPNGAQEIYWFAHYNNNIVTDVTISSDGRTAYLRSTKSNITAQEHICRMTIVSPLRRGIQFGLMDTYTFTLDATMRPGDSEAMGKQPEGDRSAYQKLYINLKDLSQFYFAVVLEVIDPDDPIPVGYTWTEMSEWEPYADTRVGGTGGPIEDVTVRGTAVASELVGAVGRIDDLIEDATHFEQLDRYYSAITNATYVVNSFSREHFANNARYSEYLDKYEEYLEMYNTYINDIIETSGHISAITAHLLGNS